MSELDAIVLAVKEEIDRRAEMKGRAEENLVDFVRLMWPYVEPARPLVEGWVLDAICEHLEAVTYGHIKRLLITVPPGSTKSLLSSVFHPAFEWGPLDMPTMRYVCASYSQGLTIRDNVRFRQIIMSPLYRELWGERFRPSKDQFSIVKTGNDQTGWKLATSVGGIGTGERGDRVVCDDPNSIKEIESEKVRDSTNQWFTEVVPTRLNDPADSAIIVIQQRTHDDDVAGVVLARGMGYEHLMIPMRYDSRRHCVTSIGWQDPRGLDENGAPLVGGALAAADGALAWPERFPEAVVKDLETTLGPYAASSQLQQLPTPRGGAIIKDTWWQSWPPDDWPDRENAKLEFPDFSYVTASLDTAFTMKKQSDYSALTVWGIWHSATGRRTGPRLVVADGEMLKMSDDERPKIMLMHAWQKRLDLHGPTEPDELRIATTYCGACNVDVGFEHSPNCKEYRRLREKIWGLVEWTIDSCRRWKVDKLLIEAKANGIDVANELVRLYANENFSVELINPVGDKLARVYAIQHLFSNGQVYAPLDRQWCQMVVEQARAFPKGKFDDLVDSTSMALLHLRETGLALRREEAQEAFEDEFRMKKRSLPLYPV